VQKLHPQPFGLPVRDRRATEGQRAIRAVIQDLHKQAIPRPVERRYRLQHPLDEGSLVIKRQLHQDIGGSPRKITPPWHVVCPFPPDHSGQRQRDEVERKGGKNDKPEDERKLNR
jgi:hypothetical protein